jgi:hypothetical protein
MNIYTIKPHQKAYQTYGVLGFVFFQLSIRIIAFLPIFLALVTKDLFGLSREHAPAFGFLLSLPLYVLIVMPFRFQAGAKMNNLNGNNRNDNICLHNYIKWLKAALLRLLRALPFLLPFLAFLITFYYYMRVPGYNESLLAISTLGEAVGGDFPAGIAIVAIVGLITLILAAIGWRIDVPFEHQAIIEQGIGASMQQAKAIRQQRRKLLYKTTIINALLTLPAILSIFGAISSYLLSLPKLGMLIMDFLKLVSIVLTLDFPTQTICLSLVFLAVLWLPLLPLRKLAINAAVAVNNLHRA